MTILIDSREPTSIFSKLKEKGLDVKSEFLEVSDYLLDNGYAIERKDKDFIQSILSNRLYDQLNNLCSYDHPVLCITIQNIWKLFYYSHSRFIDKSYIGTLTTLTCKYPNLKVIFLDGDDEFVNFIISLDKKIHDEGKSEIPKPHMRRPDSIDDRKENCLCAIQGIGMTSAKKLLNEFGSIKNIAEASEEDLKKIEKIGEKQVKNIKETLN
jgi:Fanconi anemia group M protein